MSTGAKALNTLLMALKDELGLSRHEPIPEGLEGPLVNLLRALKTAIEDAEHRDYEDYVGDDL